MHKDIDLAHRSTTHTPPQQQTMVDTPEPNNVFSSWQPPHTSLAPFHTHKKQAVLNNKKPCKMISVNAPQKPTPQKNQETKTWKREAKKAP